VVRIARQNDAPVTWRDGVHITGTRIWCDARRARDICFLSAESALHTRRHHQVIATPETLLIANPDQDSSALSVPCGHPFSLGTHRLELFRSGQSYGAASLLVQVDERRLVYAGGINNQNTGLGGSADVRACDVLVVSGRYGDPHFEFPEPAQVVSEVRDFCSRVCQRGGVAVLQLDTIGAALDLLYHIGPDFDFDAHRSIREAANRVRVHQPLPPVRLFAPRKVRSGRILLWPKKRRDALDRSGLPGGSKVAQVSGTALDTAALDEGDADEGFAFSSEAGFRGLIDYIEASGAEEIYLTHSLDDGRALREALRGRRVFRIGPTQQMSLF
jgi:putative mRNA 3-end processing factor